MTDDSQNRFPKKVAGRRVVLLVGTVDLTGPTPNHMEGEGGKEACYVVCYVVLCCACAMCCVCDYVVCVCWCASH